jgi:hypothetical protein
VYSLKKEEVKRKKEKQEIKANKKRNNFSRLCKNIDENVKQ